MTTALSTSSGLGAILLSQGFPSSPTSFITSTSYLTYPGDDNSLKTATVEYLLVTAVFYGSGACPAALEVACVPAPLRYVATSTYSIITLVNPQPTTSTTPSPTWGPKVAGLPTASKVGLIVGIILAVLVLLLVVWAIYSCRAGNRRWAFRTRPLPPLHRPDLETNPSPVELKPELEGSRSYTTGPKPELDGSVSGYGVPVERKPTIAAELDATEGPR